MGCIEPCLLCTLPPPLEAAQGGSEAPLYPNGGGIPPFPGQGPGPAHGPVSPRNTQRVLGGGASDGGASGRSGSAYEVAGHDWGSRAAAAAVQQLLGMGAQVFPPGSKEQMDWGVLAGALLSLPGSEAY